MRPAATRAHHGTDLSRLDSRGGDRGGGGGGRHRLVGGRHARLIPHKPLHEIVREHALGVELRARRLEGVKVFVPPLECRTLGLHNWL